MRSSFHKFVVSCIIMLGRIKYGYWPSVNNKNIRGVSFLICFHFGFLFGAFLFLKPIVWCESFRIKCSCFYIKLFSTWITKHELNSLLFKFRFTVFVSITRFSLFAEIIYVRKRGKPFCDFQCGISLMFYSLNVWCMRALL